MNFTNTVKDYCIRQKLFSNGDRVLIGVSGGPDSIALLYTLYELRRFFGIQIYIAHLNHGLRKQAVSEQLYVQSLSKKLRIPFFTKTIKLKKTNASLEELARESRLKFFIDITKKININAIAVGHHQDDLAETVLMRALRGTGLFGARSILPRRIINGVAVIRPLLSTNRRAIKNFLKNKKIKFYEDASNKNKKFLRNKIRLELLPRLQKEYNPNVRETLAHFSETLSLSYDYIHAQSEEILKRLTARNAHNKKRIQFNSEKITRLHPAILRELIRLSIEKLLTHTRLLTFAHIQEIENLIESQSHHAVVSLPYTLEVRKKENRIIFERKNSKYNP